MPTMTSSNENTPLSPPANMDFTALLEKAAKECKDRNARQYYRRQLKLLQNFQKDRAHVDSLQNNQASSSEALRSSSTVAAMRLAKVTLFFNLALLVVKLVAAVLSGSFSVVSSVVDSAVDITSGLIIWLTSRAIKRRDLSVYPRGRTRLEPLALILISFIMGSASIQVIGKSVEAIISRNIKPDVQINTIAIMVTTVVVKAILWILCDCFKDANSKVLAQDHRNDCISNSSAILFAYLGDRYWVYLDPIGAILVSLYLLATWIATGFKQVSIISGKAASPWIVSRITKICLDHDERCKHIDTVLVYHFGVRYLVEVHIVLDENITLKEAHDISEPLQRKIEHLPYVERAFVHVDYEFEHRPEDEHKIHYFKQIHTLCIYTIVRFICVLFGLKRQMKYCFYPPDSIPPTMQSPAASNVGKDDVEGRPDNTATQFNDYTIRITFIRKVFLIVTAQLCVVSAVVALFTFNEYVKNHVRQDRTVQLLAFNSYLFSLFYFSSVLAISFNEEVRRRYPVNFVFLGILTISLAIMAGTIASLVRSEAVMIAAAVTCLTCLLVSVLAAYVKFDLTELLFPMFVIGIGLCVYGIVLMIFHASYGISTVAHALYSALIIIFFLMYLAIDIQLIMGNKKYNLSPEEYILAAMLLYVDIIQIFINFLSLFNMEFETN
ncbi:Metal tolerance protein 9 [Trichinella pseudospiralis]|uniref:Metal tolerance protein 9 n=1 Tax=Trichinella pseudospiralis TaxID=6337 RepID=A0A0V0XWC6_TRIPS|nr:Metal tolerance protein 9 [Trichinella pseudospiralis]